MATDTAPHPPPTAIEPRRVLILDEQEQNYLIEGLRLLDEATDDPKMSHRADRLCNRVMYGDEYNDEVDELARVTLRKRRLEEEVRRCNRRIEALNDPVVEKLADVGARSITHEASGTRIERSDAIHLKYVDPSWSKDEQALARQLAGEAMRRIDEMRHFITETYHSGSVGAYFAETYKARLAAELEKPEHERTPVDPNSVIPDALREWLALDVKPRARVTQIA